jgi:uncharacterized protein YndB with AHSA1/START domain
MARNAIDIAATPDTVWSVLADAELYAEWVVGTTHIIEADPGWPEAGSALEYRVGIGPIGIGDHTVVVEDVPPRLLVLRAELHRLGTAGIRLELEPVGPSTRVVMDETPTDGLIARLHGRIADRLLRRRNDAALKRLRRLAETRA